jgi:hypothetical protein
MEIVPKPRSSPVCAFGKSVVLVTRLTKQTTGDGESCLPFFVSETEYSSITPLYDIHKADILNRRIWFRTIFFIFFFPLVAALRESPEKSQNHRFDRVYG